MDIIHSLYHYPIISNRVVAYPIIIIKKLFSIAYPNTHLSIPTPSCFSKLARPSQRPLAWQPMPFTGILYLFSIPRENGPCIDNLLYVHTLLVTYVYIHDRTFIYSICPCICIYIYVNGCVPDWSLHLLRASAGQQESMYSHYQPESQWNPFWQHSETLKFKVSIRNSTHLAVLATFTMFIW